MTTPTTVTKTSGLKVISLKVTKEGNIERKMTERQPTSAVEQHASRSLVPRDSCRIRDCDAGTSRSSGTRQSGKRSFAIQRRRHGLPAHWRFRVGQKRKVLRGGCAF